ncbi:Phospholipase [Chamberlinius hualienensis]
MSSVRRDRGVAVPYRTVFHAVNHEDLKKSMFNLPTGIETYINGCPIQCSVEIYKPSDVSKLKSTIYTVHLSHGIFNWTVRRSYADFLKLYGYLKAFESLKGESVPNFPAHGNRKALQAENRILTQLQVFSNHILEKNTFRLHRKTLKFFEISWLSFVDDLGDKHKEGLIKKKVGDQLSSGKIVGTFQSIGSEFRSKLTKRWLIVKDTYLAIIRPYDNLVREVVLMDQTFNVVKSPKHESRRAMKISNLNRELILKCGDSLNAWVKEINRVALTCGKDFIQPNRLDSFAPVRQKVLAKWFVDGSSYFDSVAEVLEMAKDEIFITDWMLSPELLLRRTESGSHWRLDEVLKRKAEEGVRVFVIIFEDVKIAMGLGSIYTKEKLMSLHPNIKVLRRRGFAQLMFWSPHDKMAIVDQQYAFFGGLDMCFGRWDDHTHKLIDLGYDKTDTDFKSINEIFATQMATEPTNNSDTNEITMTSLKTKTGSKDFLNDEKSLNISISSNLSPDKGHKWPGKDYMNFIFKDFQHIELPFEDLIERKNIPRMPWHDIACFVQGPPARDLARHFIQRWNVTKLDTKKEDTDYPLLLPRCYNDRLTNLDPALTLMSKVDCQMLRSASKWSAGIEDTESSIQNGYLKAISEAEHFIYIENQFFVTLMGGHPQVFNGIADCLYERILRAYKNKKQFRVYVVMPLLPGIEGDITSKTGVAIKAVTHYNYASICRGPNSLWGRLSQVDKGNLNPANYLTFCALRTHEEVNGQLVSELVYVHSKLMIVDDRVVIIGSANINDRSMNGGRDCEVAAIYEDIYHQKEVSFAGNTCKVGRFASSLRERIFSEHLGMMENDDGEKYDLSDPVSDEFFNNVWQKIASRNTKVYEEVFHCIPNDSVHTIHQMSDYVKETPLSSSNVEEAKIRLKKVEGHLVLLPLYFLKDEDLAPAITTKEGIMPNLLWT